ncbi:hypothetical protein M404DRAFT_998739 [Pisolithus tinctorius Marx 270]|uniref:Uncharacterized protein n=1 Tax=Pisolithus tinctorius Marx 270 TaxID=870435 RepID=A0A0C3P0I9_PISTI|nr:hypothetical protein M404DRAFT_998739 [Pisolithus tinctorius Marx 270]
MKSSIRPFSLNPLLCLWNLVILPRDRDTTRIPFPSQLRGLVHRDQCVFASTDRGGIPM